MPKLPEVKDVRLGGGAEHWREMDLGKVDLRRDLEWVYQHLGMVGVSESDAPSPGAWWYLGAVRESHVARAKFLEVVLTKLLPARKDLGEDASDRSKPLEYSRMVERVRRLGLDYSEGSGVGGVLLGKRRWSKRSRG